MLPLLAVALCSKLFCAAPPAILPLACTLDEAVHDTVAVENTSAGRDDQQICIACFRRHITKQAPAISGCKSHAARHRRSKTNHDARRDDDATYRKTRKNSIRLRAPTARAEVRLVSRARVEGGS